MIRTLWLKDAASKACLGSSLIFCHETQKKKIKKNLRESWIFPIKKAISLNTLIDKRGQIIKHKTEESFP